ncbi:MAG: two-component system response regulator CreB [Gammaproteobacteria bacterium RIFCSPHIGHO2_12_FULL_63_22]|nr:MAG: two-component system response regulator CreB [Gammaproteobacteria bacterium RIFCSPHIGHO2_12_FULL_63_22]
MSRILVVEDESTIADAVLYALRADGLQAEHFLLGRPALARLRAQPFDVVILDVGLPDISGFELCRELRQFSEVPVVFLTARDGEVDRVVGLELGADDYVVKPFSPRELVARVRARLRRASSTQHALRESGDFSHDLGGQRIRYRGAWLPLTRYEYQLLAVLLGRPGAIFSREQLMDHVWRDAPETVDRTVDTHVKTLRAKLRQVAGDADPIQTHRGQGYSLKTSE